MAVQGRAWSRTEVEATVADYFDMFVLELRGEAYNKTEHRRRLRERLDQRSDGSVEFKHRNITAALHDLDLPGIVGYKAATNYQDLLVEVVKEQVLGTPGLLALLREEVEKEAPPTRTVDDILSRLVDAPVRERNEHYRAVRERDEAPPAIPVVPNYLLREARNASLGAAGEEFVLNFERARLRAKGRNRLAGKIEQVSRTRGDHEGYDVLSFESDGRERLIEVKTTAFGRSTPFFVSANQVRQSQRLSDRYHVYRLFRFRKDPHLFKLSGAIAQTCDLEPREYRARPA